ncbi:uncharacterized protein LOC103318001 isoform X1 [Nasonia vitripennis]|uniref:Uncharacterized protein n=1 Tax=Nasonia vitripennis TaxID=7425 RepID=A0A7M7HCV4_NASVI|nr:uncharacterized protein LOC103318001 isoform X1 [Nasonia vitripennis]
MKFEKTDFCRGFRVQKVAANGKASQELYIDGLQIPKGGKEDIKYDAIISENNKGFEKDAVMSTYHCNRVISLEWMETIDFVHSSLISTAIYAVQTSVRCGWCRADKLKVKSLCFYTIRLSSEDTIQLHNKG